MQQAAGASSAVLSGQPRSSEPFLARTRNPTQTAAKDASLPAVPVSCGSAPGSARIAANQRRLGSDCLYFKHRLQQV